MKADISHITQFDFHELEKCCPRCKGEYDTDVKLWSYGAPGYPTVIGCQVCGYTET